MSVFCGGLVGAQQALMAADPMGAVPVLQREFLGLTPKGFRLGTFQVFPTADLGITYTTNVNKTDGNEQSDKIYRQSVSVAAESISERSEKTFGAKATRLDYQSIDALDTVGFSGYAGLKYFFSPGLEGRLDGVYTRDFQTRYDVVTQAAAFDPIQVDALDVTGRLRYRPGFIRWDLEGGYQDISHEDTNLTATRARVVQTDRDRSIYSVGLDAAFQRFSSGDNYGFTPFLGVKMRRIAFDKRDFDSGTNDFTGVDQSNTQYDLTAGVELNTNGKLRGTARVGYGTYRPDDDANKVQNDGVIDIDLTYLHTPLTNFYFGADRFFSNSTDTVGGTLQTRLSGRVIHELTRRWILEGDIAYTDREFNVNGEDQTFEAGLGFTHRLNRRFAVNGDVTYTSRDSNQLNSDYDDTRATVRLQTKF